jgi:hypothetical protein
VAGRTKKEHYNENCEKLKEIQKKYREENKEKVKETQKKYYEKNKEILKQKLLSRNFADVNLG